MNDDVDATYDENEVFGVHDCGIQMFIPTKNPSLRPFIAYETKYRLKTLTDLNTTLRLGWYSAEKLTV